MTAPPDNPDDGVLRARALCVAQGGARTLDGVSLEAREGEVLAVSGPRGSGKTTLLQCLSGQRLPDEGEVWFHSTRVHGLTTSARERLRRELFGWIGPRPGLVPELTAWENAALPLLLSGVPRRTAKERALEWLGHLDVARSAHARPRALTRAEQQRVAVARSLVAEPSVLFADEPTAPLHRTDHSHVLRTVVTAARARGIVVVLATADPQTAALADRTVPLVDGRVGEPLPYPGHETEGQDACSLSV